MPVWAFKSRIWTTKLRNVDEFLDGQWGRNKQRNSIFQAASEREEENIKHSRRFIDDTPKSGEPYWSYRLWCTLGR